MQQNMVQRFLTLPCGLDKHLKVVHGCTLTGEIFKLRRSKHAVHVTVGSLLGFSSYVEFFFFSHGRLR